MQILENFSKVKVLVVGDVMLDRYWWGRVERISPEAPVPVVNLNRTSLAAGGAANVAANVAGLGATPYLVGITGDDDEAKLFSDVLNDLGINTSFLIKLENRQTTTKTRVIAHSQQVVRIDQESNIKLSFEEEESVWKKIKSLLDKVNVIIISDYTKGFFTESLLSRLITSAKKMSIMVLVDPKGKDFLKYKGATLLTPNLKEIAEAIGSQIDTSDLNEKSGEKILKKLLLKALLITKGEQGMTLFEKNRKVLHIKAITRKVYDVTGAGDTVIATLAVALGAGLNIVKASNLANIAAGLVVEQVGTTAVKIEELIKALKTHT